MDTREYYKPNELEFLSLYGHFKRMIEEGTIRNDENAQQFIEVLASMAASLNDIVDLRRTTAELEVVQLNTVREPTGTCPFCMEVVEVMIHGEAVNSQGYYVNQLQCKQCGKPFDDYMPAREDDLIRWYETFFNKLSTFHEDGSSTEQLQIPIEEINSIHELYEDMRKNRASIKESKEQLQQIEATSDKQMKEVTEYLYMIYGQTISGEDQRELN